MMPSLSPHSPFTANSSHTKATQGEVKLRVVNGVLAALVLGLLYFLVSAPGRSPEDRQRQIQELQLEQKKLQSEVASLRELTVRVQSATKASQEFASGNFLARANAFSTMIKDLQDMAVKSGLYPGSVDYELMDKSNELGWTGVTVRLALEGDYPNLVRFINSVEKSKIFWIIRGLDVAGDPANGLRLNVSAETYLLPGQN
jgi:flagellar biosynthesis/type III secretory pathway M-ring protein FliF/YscJ